MLLTHRCLDDGTLHIFTEYESDDAKGRAIAYAAKILGVDPDDVEIDVDDRRKMRSGHPLDGDPPGTWGGEHFFARRRATVHWSKLRMRYGIEFGDRVVTSLDERLVCIAQWRENVNVEGKRFYWEPCGLPHEDPDPEEGWCEWGPQTWDQVDWTDFPIERCDACDPWFDWPALTMHRFPGDDDESEVVRHPDGRVARGYWGTWYVATTLLSDEDARANDLAARLESMRWIEDGWKLVDDTAPRPRSGHQDSNMRAVPQQAPHRARQPSMGFAEYAGLVPFRVLP